MPNKQRVSAAELVRNFGLWQEKAFLEPVYITHHKRDRLVLCSLEQFHGDSETPQAETKGTAKSAKYSAELTDLAYEHAALLENMDQAYAVWDSDLSLVTMNARAELLWGASRDQILGRSAGELWEMESEKGNDSGSAKHILKTPNKATQEQMRILVSRFRRVLRTRLPEIVESLNTNPYQGRTTIYPHPKGVATLYTNLTELRTLQNQAEGIESTQTALDRHPGVAFASTDARGQFTSSDDTMRLWTGFNAEMLHRSRFSDIVVTADRRKALDAFEDVMTSHTATVLEVSILGKDFTEHRLVVSLAPIMTDHNATGMTMIATRIPEPVAANVNIDFNAD